jgi:predicted dehydrogenase
VATLENAWILPETQNLVHARMELLGSKGSIYVNSSEHRAIQVYSSEGVALPDVLGMTPTGPTRTGGFITESIARFVDAVVYDQPVLATGADGLRVTRVLNAITESARTGEPVDL